MLLIIQSVYEDISTKHGDTAQLLTRIIGTGLELCVNDLLDMTGISRSFHQVFFNSS